MSEINRPIIYGLIGYPVKHSLSPAMHNAAFKEKGINAQYRLFEVTPQGLEDFLLKPEREIQDIQGNVIKAGDIKGFNITVPHKVEAKRILEEGEIDNYRDMPGDHELLVGAINTVKRNGLEVSWWNTDAPGFIKSLEEDLKFGKTKSCNALVIGCGGAGRAVVSGLCTEDKSIFKDIYVYEINSQVRKLAEDHFFEFNYTKDRVKFISEEGIAAAIENCGLLVNATSVGMAEGDSSAIDKNLLHENLSVYDVVYNRETQLLKDAKSKGLAAANGLGMLLYQGVIAWSLWMGQDAPVDIMRQALEKELSK